MQMGETKPSTTARPCKFHTEEWQRDRRVILMVPGAPKDTTRIQTLLSSVTYCLSFYHTGYSQPWSPHLTDYQLGSRPSRFFQVAAFRGIHLSPGETHTLSPPNCRPAHCLHCYPHPAISGCHTSLLFKVHPGGSSHQSILTPPNLEDKLYQKFSSLTTETGLDGSVSFCRSDDRLPIQKATSIILNHLGGPLSQLEVLVGSSRRKGQSAFYCKISFQKIIFKKESSTCSHISWRRRMG